MNIKFPRISGYKHIAKYLVRGTHVGIWIPVDAVSPWFAVYYVEKITFGKPHWQCLDTYQSKATACQAILEKFGRWKGDK